MKSLLVCVFAALAAGYAAGPAGGDRVLVYTHNGKGYIHDNRPYSVEAIRELGHENGFEVDASDGPAVFTPENLKKYKVLIFSNTNNETFDTDAQKQAFRQFIRSGGGLVGLHIATGSERQWPYYQAVIGGKIVGHPPPEKFPGVWIGRNFPATKDLPASFGWED